MLVSKDRIAPRTWGSGCFSWDLLDRADMLVAEETMPPGTSEVRHYHANARQFFFVLDGELIIEFAGERITLAAREGVEVEPGRIHRVCNESNGGAAFLAIACPTTKGDRISLNPPSK